MLLRDNSLYYSSPSELIILLFTPSIHVFLGYLFLFLPSALLSSFRILSPLILFMIPNYFSRFYFIVTLFILWLAMCFHSSFTSFPGYLFFSLLDFLASWCQLNIPVSEPYQVTLSSSDLKVSVLVLLMFRLETVFSIPITFLTSLLLFSISQQRSLSDSTIDPKYLYLSTFSIVSL